MEPQGFEHHVLPPVSGDKQLFVFSDHTVKKVIDKPIYRFFRHFVVGSA